MNKLWMTSSLRGLIGGELRVQVMDEGVHSGDASGIVPSSFRIIRQLLERLEDATSGEILVPECRVEIPPSRIEQAKDAAEMVGAAMAERFPLHGQTQTVTADVSELILNRSWRPALSYIGIDGIPAIQSAGNVQRPLTALKLSMRLPPTCNAAAASAALKQTLEQHPPYGAQVEFLPDWAADGWMAPEVEPWLEPISAPGLRWHISANRLCSWVRVGRSRSWACSGRNTLRLSLSSPVS